MLNKKLLISLSISLILNIIFITYIFLYNKSNKINIAELYIKQVAPVARHYERGLPIDRYYIFDFLNRHKKYIKGNVIEMTPLEYTDTFKENIESVTSLSNTDYFGEPTLKLDLQHTDKFPSNKYDCYICTQTLQYPYDTKATLKSAYKMLKKGGSIIITAPILSQMTAIKESWRFTEFSLRKLLNDTGFEIIDIETYGNTFAATLFIQGIAVEDIKNKELLNIKEFNCPMLVAAIAVKN